MGEKIIQPPPSATIYGDTDTGRRRVRNRLFGAVIEELWEKQDGSLVWRKSPFPIEIAQATP